MFWLLHIILDLSVHSRRILKSPKEFLPPHRLVVSILPPPTIHICFFVTSIFDLSQMPSKWNHLELSLWIQLLFHNKDSFLLLLALLVPLYCCVLFHFMNVPQYIYLFTSWRTIELLSLRELWIMSFRRFHRKQENRLRIPRQRTTWVLKLDFHFVWVNAWLTR